MGIPGVSAPSGTTAFDSTGTTSISVRNDVTHWGDNVTAGSVRSYRANNAAFTGEVYISTTDNALVTHTGLTPNTEYWFRGWSSNGVGLSSYHGSISAVTLARSTITTTDLQSTAIRLVGTATTGKYTPTTKIQYKKAVDATWIDGGSASGGTFDISASGLLPSTSYNYRTVTTTTAGSSTGSTITATTLPAAKLIMPNGTVTNAVPHVITPGGTSTMVKVKVI